MSKDTLLAIFAAGCCVFVYMVSLLYDYQDCGGAKYIYMTLPIVGITTLAIGALVAFGVKEIRIGADKDD